MAKATPAVRSFNGGEASALMEGRTDLDWYPTSLRVARNCILTPQGPMIGRSGTMFVNTARTDAETSTMLPFIFSDEQAKALEFGSDRIRFFDETGVQVYAGVAVTLTSLSAAPMVINSATLNCVVGDQVVLDGYPAAYNLNNVTANILVKVGDDYTLDLTFPALPAVAGVAKKVYAVPLPYNEAQRKTLWPVQDKDIVYLLVEGYKTKKLTRFDSYDWRLTDAAFEDGPYMAVNETLTTLLTAATGNAVPDMTTNTAPATHTVTGSSKRGVIASGGTFLGRTIPLGLAATDYFNAFDADSDETAPTYWASNSAQTSWLEYDPPAGITVDGYSIHLALDNQDASYSSKDYAPRTWTFQGWNGAAWVNLDKQINFAAWDTYKSPFFEIKVPASYTKYRIVVKQTLREGPLEVRIGRLVLRSTASKTTTITASAVTGINNDKGFVPTDVGRLLRLLGDDGYWRPYQITAVNSTTNADVTLLGEPLRASVATTQWRLGLYSDTTGYPYCGEIYNSRLYLGGPDNAVVGSVVGAYESMVQQETDGAVLDDGAIVRFVQSRRGARVQWMTSDDKGLIIGTTEGEYVAEKPDTLPNYTPTGFDLRRSTKRGSAAIEPMSIDNKTLYVQRNGRTLRQFTYTYENEGYASTNLSKWASHLGVPGFAEMDYAAEPHSIGWIRRDDNTWVGITYDPEEGTLGWHQHDSAGGEIESIVVIPQADKQQDTLWMQTRRLINGVQRRYIEYMVKAWDFGDTLDTAHYVDCALRYQGAETSVIHGMGHLEQEIIYGLADGKPIPPTQVIGGDVHLDSPASNVVLGQGFDTFVEISAIEAGTYEGTAQGKKQRVYAVSLSVWDTAYGEVGKFDRDAGEDDEGAYVFQPIEFRENAAEIAPIRLHTEIVGPVNLTPGFETRSTVAFRRPKEQPLPFNVLALMPRMSVVDED